MKNRSRIIYISIIVYILSLLSGCANEPKLILDLSEISKKENIGEKVEITGYLGIGDRMSCISRNNPRKKCGLNFRTGLDDKEFISILIKQGTKIPNSMTASTLNIEELEIRDHNGVPFPPRSRVTLIGYIQLPEEFAKSVSGETVLDVIKIIVDKETPTDDGFCSKRQLFDFVGQNELLNKFDLRKSIGRYTLNKVYSHQTAPRERKEFCGSYAEGTGHYAIFSNNKNTPDINVYRQTAFYYKVDEAKNGLNEYLEIQKRNGAKIISDLVVDQNNKTITGSFKEKMAGSYFFYQINCYPDKVDWFPVNRITCQVTLSETEKDISKFSEAWDDYEAELKALMQKEPIDMSSMSPTEVIKTFYKAIQDKDVITFKQTLSYDSMNTLIITIDRPSDEEEIIQVRGYLQKLQSPGTREIEVRNEQIDGRNATVEVKHIGDWHQAILVQEKGQWKVDPDR